MRSSDGGRGAATGPDGEDRGRDGDERPAGEAGGPEAVQAPGGRPGASSDEESEVRVLGLDFGLRRIGVAVSDPTFTLATPLETFTRRRGRRPPYRALEALARTLRVVRLVVGLPLDLEGRENEWTREVRTMGDELGRRLNVPVDYVDERFSSVRAERLVRGAGLPRKERERKERVDGAAAALILQDWLDTRPRP